MSKRLFSDSLDLTCVGFILTCIVFTLCGLTNIYTVHAQGVTMDVYSGRNFETYEQTITDANISYDWDQEGPYEDGPTSNFSVRWQGRLIPPTSGIYQFRADYDDGYRLWIDDQLIINSWSGGPAILVGEVSLRAARVTPITIEFFEQGGEARALLEWRAKESVDGFTDIPLSSLSAPTRDLGLPKVGIVVRDPRSLEGSDPARFTVYRLGELDQEIDIELVYSGEAEEGVDFVNPTRVVTIPVGIHARDFEFSRIDDQVARGNKELQVGILYTENYIMTGDNEITLTLLDDERDLSNSERFTIAGIVSGSTGSLPVVIQLSGEESHRLTLIGDGTFSSPPLPQGEYAINAWLDENDDQILNDTEDSAVISFGDVGPLPELLITLPPHQLQLNIRFENDREESSEELAGEMVEEPEVDSTEDSADHTPEEHSEDMSEDATEGLANEPNEQANESNSCVQSDQNLKQNGLPPLWLGILFFISYLCRRDRRCTLSL